jgi:EpsI family protein
MKPRAMITVVLLVSAAVARHAIVQAKPMHASVETIRTFPLTLGEWRSAGDVPFTGAIESILGVDEYINRVYQDGQGDEVGLYVGYYRVQRQGAAIHSPLNCLPGAGWQPVASERVRLSGSDEPVVNRLVVQKGEAQQIVYYWYQAYGRIVASEYWSKFYLVSDSITRRRSDAALVRVVVPVAASETAREAGMIRGRAFASIAAPSVKSILFE